MASDPETASSVHTCGAAVNVSSFPSWEVFSAGSAQTQACHCWGGTAVPTVLGSPTGPQNHTNPELRSPLSLLQFPLSTKSWFAAGPASPGTCLADLFMFQRVAAAAPLLWKTFPLSFSWSSHSMKNLHKALKNFSRQSFRNEVAIWFFFALRCFLFSSKIIRFFLTAISHNGNKY